MTQTNYLLPLNSCVLHWTVLFYLYGGINILEKKNLTGLIYNTNMSKSENDKNALWFTNVNVYMA